MFLGKTFLRGYYFDRYGGPPLEDRLNDFYETHNYCDLPKAESKPYDTDLFPLPEGFELCDGAFDIVYESGEGCGYNRPKEDAERREG